MQSLLCEFVCWLMIWPNKELTFRDYPSRNHECRSWWTDKQEQGKEKGGMWKILILKRTSESDGIIVNVNVQCKGRCKGNILRGSGFYFEDMFLSQRVSGEIVAQRYTLSSAQAACMAYILELFLYRHLSMTSRLKLYNLMSIHNNFSWLCSSRQ